MIYFRTRVSFSANFCAMFIAFVQPVILSAIDRLLPTPAYQRKVLRSMRVLLVPGYQEALPKFWVVSRVNSLLTIRDRHW